MSTVAPSSSSSSSSLSITERKDLMLVPYLVLTSLYMVAYNPFLHFPPETLGAAVLKAAPIWYLAGYVGLAPKFPNNALAVGVRAGLVLSSLGDMCLVWRVTLFLPGMFFFGLAHMAYIYGLRAWLRKGHYQIGKDYVRETVAVCVVLYLFILAGIGSWVMAACVLVYAVLIFTMTNLALQRHLVEGNRGSFYGLVGAISFVVSDFLIGVAKWIVDFPASEAAVMVTYYVAQAAIAFGAVNSARAKRRE